MPLSLLSLPAWYMERLGHCCVHACRQWQDVRCRFVDARKAPFSSRLISLDLCNFDARLVSGIFIASARLGVEKAGYLLGEIFCRALTSADTITEGMPPPTILVFESAEIFMYGPDQISTSVAAVNGLPMLISTKQHIKTRLSSRNYSKRLPS
jgi:hypothetical protein